MTSRIGQPDTDADLKLRGCLDKAGLNSFVMVSGAGSGKTTSLVKALAHNARKGGKDLLRRGQQIACITYTEVAEREILEDVGSSPLFHVSTIHSFLWSVASPFQNDIREWVASRIDEKVSDHQTKLAAPRTRASTKERATKEISRLNEQKKAVSDVPRFTYGVGSDYANGILGHDDIIRMVPALIAGNGLMRTVIARRFPFILVDESQDTNADVVAALKAIDLDFPGRFCLGFFGDPMQRIYMTGLGRIHKEDNWAHITKLENFRCPQRVLAVINSIRSEAPEEDRIIQTRGRQVPAGDTFVPVDGYARLFVLPIDERRSERLKAVCRHLAAQEKDDGWLDEKSGDNVRILVLVHRMAAKRLGFGDLYSAMNDGAPSTFKDGFLEGSSWAVRPFLQFVLPLVEAHRAGDDFAAMNLLRRNCPLLDPESLERANISKVLGRLNDDIDTLSVMLGPTSASSVLDVMNFVRDRQLAILHDRLLEEMAGDAAVSAASQASADGDADDVSVAIASLFACPANQFWGYRKYIDDESPFSTQQGIKGAEFPRVLVVLDDEEGSYNLFSYDKYFGLAPLSEGDRKHMSEGEETVVDRTRRLFYVCCSRATQSLAVALFAQNPANAAEKIKARGIFPADQVRVFDGL
jgi:DNA helicase-2/ATP-dependent DNA helicase PcrA